MKCSLLIPIVVLGLFCAFAGYCYGRIQPIPQPAGYTQSERAAMDRKIAALNEYASKRHQRLSGSDERAALRYLYGDGQ